MSSLPKPDIVRLPGSLPVQFACTCGQLKPISKIYFCRHCLKLRCGFCVCHEIDSIYCPNCLENMPSQEARLRKNKCSGCFDCPCCFHALSTRAAPGVQKNPEEKATRKVYYLVCLNCHWTSRDVGIPDQTIASGGWPERENVHANRINAIQAYYKNLVLWEKHEKQDKQRKKLLQRGKYATLSDKIGITAAMARKRAGLPEQPGVKPNFKAIEPAEAQEFVGKLPNSIFTEKLNLNLINSLPQRLIQPEWQPATVDKMFPVRKSLLVKRSQRCRTCEHNVSKPEYNPNSTKFKIQLLACYHIPDVRLVTVQPLRAGSPCEVIIKLCNPTQHQTSITFFPLPTTEEELQEIQFQIDNVLELAEKREEPKSLSSGRESLLSLPKQVSLPEDPRLVETIVNSNIQLPQSTIVLPARDDAAEYDDAGDVHNYQDDPKIVLWRKFNKVALKFTIIPYENLQIGDTVIMGFTMQHIYTNTITTLDNKEPKKIEHKAKVYVTLGNLVGSD